MTVSGNFSEWLNDELERRGWSQSEAARRGGISSQMISVVLSETANPGLETLRGIARAFRMPLEDVFRLAGILPHRRVIGEPRALYAFGEDDEVRLVRLYRELPENDRGLVIELVERLTGRTVARIVGATDATDQSG